MRYLSLDWIDALTDAVSRSVEMAEAAATHTISVTQVVTDTPDGEVSYHLVVTGGQASFGAGPADHEEVRFVQDWDTAVGVATGRLDAQEAFIKGHIRLTGDQQKLIDSQPVFRALDAVFNEVRERTVYE